MDQIFYSCLSESTFPWQLAAGTYVRFFFIHAPEPFYRFWHCIKSIALVKGSKEEKNYVKKKVEFSREKTSIL